LGCSEFTFNATAEETAKISATAIVTLIFVVVFSVPASLSGDYNFGAPLLMSNANLSYLLVTGASLNLIIYTSIIQSQ